MPPRKQDDVSEDESDTEAEPTPGPPSAKQVTDSAEEQRRKKGLDAASEMKELRARLEALERENPALKGDRAAGREAEKLKHQNADLQKKLERREEEIYQLRLKLPPPDPKGFAYHDEADSAASILIISKCPPEAKDCLAAQIPDDCKIPRTQAQMLDMMVTGADNEIESLRLQMEELTEAHEAMKRKFRTQTKTLDTQTKMITDLMNANVAAMAAANQASRAADSARTRPGKIGTNWFSIREFEKQELAVRGSIFELQTTKKALEAEIARLSKPKDGRS